MKTNRTIINIIALTLFAPLAHAADVQYLALTGRSVIANFDMLDTSTCAAGILTHISVEASFDAIRSPGSTEKSPIASVFIDRYDFCHNTRLIFATGYTTNFDLRINANLKTASLRAKMKVDNFVTNTSTDAEVDIVWTGTGMADRDSFSETTQLPGVTITTHSQGNIREASASGSLVLAADGIDYTPDPSVSAFIQKNASTEVTISR